MRIYLLKRRGELSEESIAKGKQTMISLYFCYNYGPNTKREYEWLSLYLYEKPKNQLQKDHNKETLYLAESIRAKRVLEAQSSRYGFRSSTMGKTSFLEYFKKLANIRREDSDCNYQKWIAVHKMLFKFNKGKDIMMDAVDEDFLERLKEFLLSDQASVRRPGKKLGRNSASSYFNIVKTALNEAYRAKMLRENPSQRVKCITGVDTHRQFLTFEELQTLSQAPCDNPKLKRAFLFSALTGLRWSDVSRLVWGQLKYNETEGWIIHYIQKKTKKNEILPVSEQAIKFLGDKKDADKKLFPDLYYTSHNNEKLQEWVKKAGIDKKITFHCARHSFATLQLTMDTDIYTVSKLLGHRHLRTTEIYAKVIDKKKIEAARKIPQIQL